jgi:hypothetical protein
MTNGQSIVGGPCFAAFQWAAAIQMCENGADTTPHFAFKLADGSSPSGKLSEYALDDRQVTMRLEGVPGEFRFDFDAGTGIFES